MLTARIWKQQKLKEFKLINEHRIFFPVVDFRIEVEYMQLPVYYKTFERSTIRTEIRILECDFK